MNPISMLLNGILDGFKPREYAKDQTTERRWFEFCRLKPGVERATSNDDIIELGCALVTVPVSPDHLPNCEHEYENIKAYLRTLDLMEPIKDEPFEWTGAVVDDKIVVDDKFANKLITDKAEIAEAIDALRRGRRKAQLDSVEEQLREVRLIERRAELMQKLVTEPYGWDGKRLVFERILTDEEIDAVRHEWVFPDGKKGHTGGFAMSNANHHR